MSGFQDQLRRQITRFGLLLSVSFFVVFMSILFIYSIYFNSYRARNYNKVLSEEFGAMYETYRVYASSRGDGWTGFMRCLDGEISGTALSFGYLSFSRECSIGSNLILTNDKGEVVSTSYGNLTYSQRVFNAHVVDNTLAQGAVPYNTVYFFENEPRYVYAQPLYDAEDGTFRGVACMYLDTAALADNMRTLQYSGIIVHPGSSVIVAADRGMVKSFNHFDGIADGLFKLGDQQYWLHSSEMQEYGVKVYTYVAVIPIWGYYLICIVFSVALFFLVILLAIYATKNMAQHSAASVEQLQAEIDLVAEKGSGVLTMKTGDEFEDIADHINAMLDSMRQLTDHNFELLRLNADMELRTLESKFHPHFLYNTLESIRFAIQLGLPGADAVLQNLTKLLRYNVSHSEEQVTLGEDLLHIRNYLDIMKFRFGDRFMYRIDIDADCMRRFVPRLLLQPMLGNSVRYGFEGRQSVSLSIKGAIDDDGLLRLTVTDNGMGMKAERLMEVQEMVAKPGDTQAIQGYSELKSTARRLQLQYGGRSCVRIKSTYGAGTQVVIHVEERGERDVLQGSRG